ncbi:uncharacterized protein LOC126841264 [Adelges cooleyi]|uniref:uncharacterized protein LOC126841264 n=1 Tax=Adelges cooleyi TaxID=133065 RepID=UPI002180711B|nr:uncharacterized protein LOC126841264 [Adelges cooleyi]
MDKVDGGNRKSKNCKKTMLLKRFSPVVLSAVDSFFEELLCDAIFDFHMELNLETYDPKDVMPNDPNDVPDEALCRMTDELNINKINQDIDCPKCCTLVKCPWLSKHLAHCMNPHKHNYSHSARNSSRIARQRIQDGFKTGVEESKNGHESEDEPLPSKKRSNKSKKTKFKGVRSGLT